MASDSHQGDPPREESSVLWFPERFPEANENDGRCQCNIFSLRKNRKNRKEYESLDNQVTKMNIFAMLTSQKRKRQSRSKKRSYEERTSYQWESFSSH